MVIGNGSNLLVRDKGIRGAVIQIYSRMADITADGDVLEAKGGALLSAVAAKAAESSLTGLEFASGIPGSIGGAVVMNAGAYGGEMKDVLVSVDVLTADLEVKTIPAEELELGYRHSIVPEAGYIVLGAKLKLTKGDSKAIYGRMAELAGAEKRKTASAVSQRRQHIQTSRRLFCRQTGAGCRAERQDHRRRAGFRKAFRLPHQCGRGDGAGYSGPDRFLPERSQRKIRRNAGNRSEDRRRSINGFQMRGW